MEKRLYLWDLGEGEKGHFIGVVKAKTVERWRRVPKRIISHYAVEPDESEDEPEDDSE